MRKLFRWRPYSLFVSLLVCVFYTPCFAQNFPDSITVQASKKYNEPGFLKIFFLGVNYREEWSVPVKMPVFNLRKDPRGFSIKEFGGGEQTRSLDLLDREGNEWALRTVDKDVEKALPGALRNKFFQSIVQDLISAAYPYGGLSIPVLSNAVNIEEGPQELYYVPDDSALGQYRSIMANSVCLLVLKESFDVELEKTEEIIPKIESGNYLVDQEALLRARLLDWLTGDWDRHEDQWRWAVRDSAGLKWYYPVPRDRDQVFFYSDGMLVRTLTRFFMPHVNGFDKRAHSIKRLGYKSRAFDLSFLNSLDRKQWEAIVRDFQARVTDSVITEAVRRQPAEIYAISGKIIEDKLRSRRDNLFHDAINYYEYLARQVTIVASFKDDRVRIQHNKDNTLVTVYSQSTTPVYQRSFQPGETKKILVAGLEGNDNFRVDGEAENIKLYLQGGEGQDVYSGNEMGITRIKDDD